MFRLYVADFLIHSPLQPFVLLPVDTDLISFFHDQLFCLKLLDGAADAFQAKACLICQILPAFADA